jgi:hypothetical protein
VKLRPAKLLKTKPLLETMIFFALISISLGLNPTAHADIEASQNQSRPAKVYSCNKDVFSDRKYPSQENKTDVLYSDIQAALSDRARYRADVDILNHLRDLTNDSVKAASSFIDDRQLYEAALTRPSAKAEKDLTELASRLQAIQAIVTADATEAAQIGDKKALSRGQAKKLEKQVREFRNRRFEIEPILKSMNDDSDKMKTAMSELENRLKKLLGVTDVLTATTKRLQAFIAESEVEGREVTSETASVFMGLSDLQQQLSKLYSVGSIIQKRMDTEISANLGVQSGLQSLFLHDAPTVTSLSKVPLDLRAEKWTKPVRPTAKERWNSLSRKTRALSIAAAVAVVGGLSAVPAQHAYKDYQAYHAVAVQKEAAQAAAVRTENARKAAILTKIGIAQVQEARAFHAKFDYEPRPLSLNDGAKIAENLRIDNSDQIATDLGNFRQISVDTGFKQTLIADTYIALRHQGQSEDAQSLNTSIFKFSTITGLPPGYVLGKILSSQDTASATANKFSTFVEKIHQLEVKNPGAIDFFIADLNSTSIGDSEFDMLLDSQLKILIQAKATPAQLTALTEKLERALNSSDLPVAFEDIATCVDKGIPFQDVEAAILRLIQNNGSTYQTTHDQLMALSPR